MGLNYTPLPSELALMSRLEGTKKTHLDLNSEQLSNLFIKSSLLVEAVTFIREEFWLKNQKQLEPYHQVLSELFQKSLVSLLYFRKFFIDQGEVQLKHIELRAKKTQDEVIELILEQNTVEQQSFLIHSLKEMLGYFLEEEHQVYRGIRLYRTFEKLDKVLNLEYQFEKSSQVDIESNERLYQGAGVNVQSGYSSILLVLDYLQLKKGDIFVDLGSGYGRVCLVGALINTESIFIGYEFVKHRVDSGCRACQNLDLEDNLVFICQDLSQNAFRLPVADVYYLYDPFSKETYKKVLLQIEKISKIKVVKIVTKGNAKSWLQELADKNRWDKPIEIDNGNLCIFISKNIAF